MCSLGAYILYTDGLIKIYFHEYAMRVLAGWGQQHICLILKCCRHRFEYLSPLLMPTTICRHRHSASSPSCGTKMSGVSQCESPRRVGRGASEERLDVDNEPESAT